MTKWYIYAIIYPKLRKGTMPLTETLKTKEKIMFEIKSLNDLKEYVRNIKKYGNEVVIYENKYETKIEANEKQIIVVFNSYGIYSEYFYVYLEIAENYRISKIEPLLGPAHIEFSKNNTSERDGNDIPFIVRGVYDPEYVIPENLMELLFKKDDWMLGLKGRIVYIVHEVLKEHNKEKNEVIKNNIEKFLHS